MEEQAEKKSFLSRGIFNTRIKSANVKPLEMILGYLVGPFGGLLSSQIFVVYLNVYWTDVLGIDSSSAFLTLFPLISIVFIVIGNVVVGQLLDRVKTPQGKVRPFILLAAPLIAVTVVLMFAVPTGNTVLELVWVAVSYNLYYSIAYPIYNTANAMTISLSTRNSKQRGPISTINSIALVGASSCATIVLPMIMPFLGVDKELWLIFMCVVAAFSLCCILLQYYFTRERITEENMKLGIKEERVPVAKQLKAVVTDKYWWMIILFYVVFLLVGSMQNFSMAYYCNYVLGTYSDGYTQTVLGIVTGIPLALGMVFSWPLAKKFGKKNTTLVGLIVSAAGCLIAFINPTSWVFVGIGLFIKCLGAAPANYVMMALFADVLDHIEARFGFRCDGFSLSLRSIVMATMLSICQGVFNGLISMTGYLAPDEVTGEAFTQNEATQNVIVWCYIGVMMVGYVLCAIIIFGLNVEKHLDEEHQIILDRQKEAVLAQGGEWIEPAERMRLEEEEFARKAEEARVEELRARCEKKGLSFEEEEAKYQRKLAAKQQKKKGGKDSSP